VFIGFRRDTQTSDENLQTENRAALLWRSSPVPPDFQHFFLVQPFPASLTRLGKTH
jgi:hypothetical protein